MEDTLGEYMETIKLQRVGVLILVLMEDYSRRRPRTTNFKNSSMVLILVLMEDTLGVSKKVMNIKKTKSLNPCFNGRYSRRYNEFTSK